MTDHKKVYTNTDIIKRLDAMDAWRTSMDGRMSALEVYKISQDSGRAAVDAFVTRQAADKANRDRDRAYSSIKDFSPYIILILAAVAAILYAKIGNTH